MSIIEPVSGGAVNDTPLEIIRKFFNPALKGPAWDALLTAVATGEAQNWQDAANAFRQLFLTTANDTYLIRRASDRGIQKPLNVGMVDDVFREFALSVTNNQLTEEAFLEVLEVFYGSSAVRASDISGQGEPYALSNGDDLTILVDEELPVTTVFHTADFASIGQALAVEVAAAITRAMTLNGSNAYALPVTNAVTGLTSVQVYSPSRGLKSGIRTTGGKAQNALQFSTLLSLPSTASMSFPTWNVTVNSVAGTMRFTTTGPSNLDLSGLVIGDYVNIFGSQFQAVNRGSFPVTNVVITYSGSTVTQYFEVSNSAAIPQTGVAQTATSDILYFRPTRHSIHTSVNRAVTVTNLGTSVQIKLPATSIAVGRGPNTAAYGQVDAAQAITALVRNNGTVTATVTSHGLIPGQWIFVDNARSSITPPTVTLSHSSSLTNYSLASVWSEYAPPVRTHVWGGITVLQDGRVISAGGWDPNGFWQAYDDLLTIGSAIVHPSGTQYPVSLVQDAGIDQDRTFTSLVTLTDPAAAGKALIFGGYGTNINTFATTSLLYTPVPNATGSWGSSAATVSAFAGRAAVNRSDNKVMAIGGATLAGGAQSACEVYTYGTNSWASKASLATARCQPQAIQLQDGTVLATGGRTSTSFTSLDYSVPSDLGSLTNSCELYNVGGNTWSAVGAMAYARVGHQLFLLSDGRVLCLGGIGYNPIQSSTNAYLNSTEIYTPATQRWSPGPSMRVARAFFAAGVIGNRLYVAGGNATDVSTEYLDLTTFRWYASPAVLFQPILKTAGVVTNGFLVLDYGVLGSNQLTDTDLHILTVGNDTFMSGGLNGLHQVSTVVDTNNFTYSTPGIPGYTSASGGTITPLAAQTSTIPGPIAFDLDSNAAVTSSMSPMLQDITAGHQYTTLSVVDATQFPDAPGYLCVAFGFENQVTTIPYLGRASANALVLDYSFVFPESVLGGPTVAITAGGGTASFTLTTAALPSALPAGTILQLSGGAAAPELVKTASYVAAGATSIPIVTGIASGVRTSARAAITQVVLLAQKGAYVPVNPETLGSFYLTDSPAGRIAAQAAITDIAAGGLEVDTTVIYPGDRGLGNEGYPTSGNYKLSDVVEVFGPSSGEDIVDEETS